ncbi:MAG: cyanophycinase [Bacteroidetes bacterium]|nr:cyanophycinase [Bacteroidota bacterium]
MRKLKFFTNFTLICFFLINGPGIVHSYAQQKTGNASKKVLDFIGPEKGTLIIIGGNARDPIFLEKFKEYAGGDDAKIIIVPTAWEDDQIEKDSGFVNFKARFEKAGFKNVTVLHTRDSKLANDPEFYTSITYATGVWFDGGRQWRIADGFLNTRAHEEFNKLLDRGGVIAGSSAGASIQGSYLARGDSKGNTIMMGDHEVGLGFLKNSAIDQHILVRNRQFDIFEILKNRPELFGIGLDENTGIVVKGNEFEVIGNSFVAIYDGTRFSRERDTIYQLPADSKEFYFLRKGDKYNLKERKVNLER